MLAAHPLGKRSIILRLAGIYGPGACRSSTSCAPANRFRRQRAGYLNLIHVDDAADSCRRGRANSSQSANGPRVYCVSDGQPVERGEYYSEVARQIGAPPPRFVEPDPNSPRAARAEANRRVRNDADARRACA